jgi:hypothetical protein
VKVPCNKSPLLQSTVQVPGTYATSKREYGVQVPEYKLQVERGYNTCTCTRYNSFFCATVMYNLRTLQDKDWYNKGGVLV